MTKTIFSDFGFISLGRVKTVKVFDTKKNSMVAKGLMVVGRPLKGQEPLSRGYRLFYTCAPEQIRRSQLELCETLA
jgi:hypothetical protein